MTTSWTVPLFAILSLLNGIRCLPAKNFNLGEPYFVPSICIEAVDNDNPFVQGMLWRATKEVNDKFDDEAYLLPFKVVKAKRNACVAGFEYMLEFEVIQSSFSKADYSYADLRHVPLRRSLNIRVLKCKATVFEEPFVKKEQISIESCKNA
uniref:Cystatin domain-containing protein n=1 Tax=Steinernema glaseri TaxID=37863 RepID=A0A1I7ZUU3_9BILA